MTPPSATTLFTWLPGHHTHLFFHSCCCLHWALLPPSKSCCSPGPNTWTSPLLCSNNHLVSWVSNQSLSQLNSRTCVSQPWHVQKRFATPISAAPSLLITATQTRPFFSCSEKSVLEPCLIPFLLSHLGFSPLADPTGSSCKTYSESHHLSPPSLPPRWLLSILQRSLLTGLHASVSASTQQLQLMFSSSCQTLSLLCFNDAD